MKFEILFPLSDKSLCGNELLCVPFAPFYCASTPSGVKMNISFCSCAMPPPKA